MRIRLPVVAALTVVWMLLWGSADPLIVVGGVIVAVVVMAIFPFPPAMWRGRLRPLPFLRLVAVFVADLVAASMQVAWLTIRPQAPPRSAVICVQMVSRSEFLLTLTSELVSLVPGSLLIELDSASGRLWVHVLNGSSPARVEKARADVLAQERRVLAALGSPEERAACESAVAR